MPPVAMAGHLMTRSVGGQIILEALHVDRCVRWNVSGAAGREDQLAGRAYRTAAGQRMSPNFGTAPARPEARTAGD